MSVLVTGATGNVGREVMSALRARGVQARGVGRAELDFRRPETWREPLEGSEGVFLLRPPAIADVDVTLNRFVDEARRCGVRSIVFLSVLGAGTNRFVPHHAVEAHLAAGPADWTTLRPGFFAQNLQDAYLRDLREDDRLYVPAGRGRVAFVDVRDVAEVAAEVFVRPDPHRRAAYPLTGGEAVTFDEVARLSSHALGRPIRYVPASIPGYALHLRRRGLPWGQVAVQTILHGLIRIGHAERVDPTLERLLGRPPRPVREYIEDHAETWSKHS